MERLSKMADRFERPEQVREEMSHGLPVWNRFLANETKRLAFQDRGYTPQGNSGFTCMTMDRT